MDRSNAISEALNGARKAISWAREALDEALTQATPVGLSHPAGGNPPPQQGAAPDDPSNRRKTTISELSTMSQQPQTARSADSSFGSDEFTVSVGAQPAAASSSGGPMISSDKFSVLDPAAVALTDDSSDIASLAKSSQGLPGNRIASPSLEAPEQDAAAAANAQDDEGSPGMRGSLSQIGLATILTLLAGGEETGILILSHPDGGTGRILIRSGIVLKIEIDGKPEMEPVGAVSGLIKWKEAAFVFQMIDVTAADEVKIPVQRLLMEAAQIFDEA